MAAVVNICSGDGFTLLMKEFSDFCDEIVNVYKIFEAVYNSNKVTVTSNDKLNTKQMQDKFRRE